VNPLVSLVIALTLAIVLLRKRINIGISLLVSSIVYGLLAVPLNLLPTSSFDAIFSKITLSLFISLISALYIAFLLGRLGVLDKVTELFKSIGYNAAALGIPPSIGLLPMPGGALVSAIMLKDVLLKDLRLEKGLAVFTNYWFRHILVPVWPLYQALLITAAILAVDVSKIIYSTWPASLASIMAGLAIYLVGLKKTAKPRLNTSKIGDKDRAKYFVEGFTPFLLVAVLVIGLKIKVWIALPIVALVTTIIYKARREYIKYAVTKALDPEILAIIAASMFFREYITISKANLMLLEAIGKAGIPVEAIVFIIPFIMGFISGGELGFAALSMPLLAGIIGLGDNINAELLLLAFGGGYIGVLSSPLHLCFILTLKHYETRFREAYKYIIIGALLTTIIMTIYVALV